MSQIKYEDVIMKRVMNSFAQSGLRFLGITDEAVEPVETELVTLEIQDLLMDHAFRLPDGSYLHLEFQSTDKGVKDLRRFRKYEAILSEKKGAEVVTYVVYTNDIKNPQTTLKNGINTYQVKAVLLADWDSRQVLSDLKAALRQEQTLSDEQITALAFVPVMSRQTERVEVLSEAVQISHQIDDSQRKMDVQAILFAFASKFLTGQSLERIKEEIAMTQLGQMIYDDGKKKGIEQGRILATIELARELLDILSDEAIAKKTKLPLSEVQRLRAESQH